MILKKIFLVSLFVSFIFAVHACVDDDVCDKQVTPNLTIAFVDSISKPLTLDSLYVDKLSSDGKLLQMGIFSKVDSIRVPLNSFSNETKFYFYTNKNADSLQKDILAVTYNTSQSFVSKACGFKVSYNDVKYQLLQTYKIKNLSPITNKIENESKDLYITY